MAEYTVPVHVMADSEEEVEKILNNATWVDSYDAIEEVPSEIEDDDDDDDEV